MNPYNSSKNKLKKTYDNLQETDNQLFKKEKTFDQYTSDNIKPKVPTTILDTGWINAKPSEIIIDTNVFVINAYNTTALKGQEAPVRLGYQFISEMNIPESLLAELQSVILTKKSPNATVQGTFEYSPFTYVDHNYVRVKGDSTLIYQGYYPYLRIFTQEQIDNGDLLSGLTSKWYQGTLKWTDSGDSYELRNGFIEAVRTYFNVVDSGHGKNWDRFDCRAIDSISSSSVTGTGTLVQSRMIENPVGSGDYFQVLTTTLNVTMTAPLFSDVTHVNASGGLYKNSVHQATYQISSPYYVKFAGSLNGASTLPFGEAGTAVLTSFDYAHDNLFRLFYSSTRADEFRYEISSNDISNVPASSHYQTGTVPYSYLYHEVNPSGYPLTEQANNEKQLAYGSQSKPMWSEVQNDQRYKHCIRGDIVLTAPATLEVSVYRLFVDEEWKAISGVGFVKQGENRYNKEYPTWKPDIENMALELRLLVSYSGIMHSNDVKNITL